MSSGSVQSASNQIAELNRQFESCSREAQKLAESLREADFKQRPGTGGWSVAECIAHLTLTNQFYFPVSECALKDAPAGNGPYKMDWRGRLLKWFLEPPYRTKVKTLPSMEPHLDDASHVLPEYLDSQRELIQRLQKWEGRALDKVFIPSPFSNRVRYNIYSMFHVIAAHQRHHIWQAQRVKDLIKGK
jgi:hypothetical protein